VIHSYGRRLGLTQSGSKYDDLEDAPMKRLSIRVRAVAVAASMLAALLFTGPRPGNATDIDANSFRCITKMTPVRQFYVDNLNGHLEATLAAANSAAGAVYPPGSVLQLLPTEVMVKRDRAFDATTHDWEFFFLEVSKDGTRIHKRGTTDVVNQFGASCFDCHAQAAPQWDLVCETDHGCAPLPLTPPMIRTLQRTDARCGNPVSAEDAETLKQVDEVLKAFAKQLPPPR
jgi:hypothetical protein